MMRKFTNVILLNYSGFPEYTSYFLVENGLAYLAAILSKEGFKVSIRDYVTIDTAERLFPYEHAADLRKYRALTRSQILNAGRVEDSVLQEVRSLEAEIDQHSRGIVQDIAREIEAEIMKFQADVLGIKLWSQPSLHDVIFILDYLKARFPSLKMIAGGGHVDYFLEGTLKTISSLDAAAYADGEVGFVGYLRALNGETRMEEVPNLIYRDLAGTIHTNRVQENPTFRTSDVYPLFDPETYPAMASESQKMKTIPFEDSRGCQYSCDFCAHPIKSGNKLRLREPQRVVEEIAFLNERYGFIHFTGSGSNTPFHHACSIYKELHARGLDVAVNFFQSLRDFRIERADIMRRSHIPLFWVGVETASQDLLNVSYHKKRSMERTREVCAFLNDARIGYIMSLIYPSLGESEATTADTIEFVREVGHGHIVIYPPLIQPRTPWMDSPHIQWLDRESFIDVTQFGIEEVKNHVLPPMVTSEVLNGLLLINGGKTYRDIYYDNVRFRAELDRICAGVRGYKREFQYTEALEPFIQVLNDTFWTVDQSLDSGDFDAARTAMIRFNNMATAGSVAATATISVADMQQVENPRVIMRTGGPA
jgi:radical SAM superfamily enzyme YgiQ (UPF0313 family)